MSEHLTEQNQTEVEDQAPTEIVDVAIPEPQPIAPPPEPKRVPLAELMEERKRRQEIERELMQLRAQSDASVSEIRNLVKTLQPAPAAAPDINTDPLGYLQYENQQLRSQIEEVKAWREQQEQVRQQQAAHQSIMGRFQTDAVAFQQEAPDFAEAYDWVSKQVLSELQVAGMPPAEAAAYGQQLALNIVRNAAATGGNAAKGFYDLARQKGWKGKQAAQQQSATPSVETVQRVAAANRGVSGPGAGTKGYDGLTASQAAAMSQEEYDKIPQSVRLRLLRGA